MIHNLNRGKSVQHVLACQVLRTCVGNPKGKNNCRIPQTVLPPPGPPRLLQVKLRAEEHYKMLLTLTSAARCSVEQA